MCLQPISIEAYHCVTLLHCKWLCVNSEKKSNSLIRRIMLTWLTLSLLFVKHCQFHSTVRQTLIFLLALTSVYLAKSLLKFKKKHWKTKTWEDINFIVLNPFERKRETSVEAGGVTRDENSCVKWRFKSTKYRKIDSKHISMINKKISLNMNCR